MPDNELLTTWQGFGIMLNHLHYFCAMKLKILFASLTLCLAWTASFAQDDENESDWRVFRPRETASDTSGYADTDTVDVRSLLRFDGNIGSVAISKDNRIEEVIEFLGTPMAPDPVQIDGYRVQIFFDKNIDRSRDIKASFMSSYPKVKAYMDWDAPNHYVRVGNFRSELHAMKFQQFIKDQYPETTVIKTRIDLPDLDLELEGYNKK